MEELLKMLCKAEELGVPYKVSRSDAYYSVYFDFESDTISHRHAMLFTGNETSRAQVRSEAFWAFVARLEEDREGE